MKKAKRFSAAFLAIVLVLSMVVFAPAAVRAEGQYTVSFDSKGGSEVKSITADAGQLIQKPENPTKEEYTFAGWYTDSKYKDRWDFEEDVMPDGNLTLIAKWVTGEEAAALADEYAEEGSGNGEDPVWDETYVPETDPYIPDQDVYDVTETDPYVSDTDLYDVTETDPYVSDTDVYDVPETDPEIQDPVTEEIIEDVTDVPEIYPEVQEPSAEDIIADVTDVPEVPSVPEADPEIQDPEKNPAVPADQQEAEEADPGNEKKDEEPGPLAPAVYKIKYYKNGGTINGEYATEYNSDEGAVLPADVTKAGCIFGGWYANEDLTGSPAAEIAKGDSGNKVFYAKWNLEPAVEDCIAKIDAIGTVRLTEKSRAKIDAAREAYNGLTSVQKKLVSNYSVLVEAESTYALLEMEVDDCIAKIDAIGSVRYTEESLEKILTARAAYDALDKDQRKLVSNASVLKKAEKTYAELEAEVEACEIKINSIGKVEYNDTCKARINAARKAYDALGKNQRAAVENYGTLTAAEEEYASLQRVEECKTLIDAIGKVEYSDACKAKIDAARAAYDKLSKSEKNLVTNYSVLTDAEKEYESLIPREYRITSGANALWKKGTNGGLTFKGDGDFSLFQCVKVDGAVLAASNYTATGGSTVVTLKKEFMDKLALGTHTFQMVWKNGTASAKFAVAAGTGNANGSTTVNSPKTGDTTNAAVWFVLIAAAAGAMAALVVVRRRRR